MNSSDNDASRHGLLVDRLHTLEGQDPYGTVTWEERTAQIKDDRGQVIFEQQGVEVPAGYSQLATNILASKYFYGARGSAERESSARQTVSRVADTIADWGRQGGYFASAEDAQAFQDELSWLLLHQHGAFNSPVWFNVGLHHKYGVTSDATNWRYDVAADRAVPLGPGQGYEYPQASACFIQSVSDNMQDIMRLATAEAMLFKYGSGTGTDLSTLRSSKERLSGGGIPSGPVSFMRVYDSVASVVKSGGKCLAYDQPVFTAGGVRTAHDLAEAGDDFVVLSWSNRKGRVAAKPARAWFSGTKPMVEVVTDKGTFRVSHDHPFMLRTGQPVRAAHLVPGMSLLSTRTKPSGGYVHVKLGASSGSRWELLHRLVAKDVLGWKIDGHVVHHHDAVKANSSPENLVLLKSHAEHASLHSRAAVAGGRHPFQANRFPHRGAANGMHASAPFWQDEAKADAYRETQGQILRDRGNAATMQASARKVRMLNLGYELINAGHDIATFEGYVAARKAAGRRCPSVPGQKEKFAREFGSYEAFYQELRHNNHEVLSVRPLGEQGVVSIEVADDEPDDKRPWSEHNYAICPIEGDASHSVVYVYNTRRAAKMQTIKDWHPDVLQFAGCKSSEEKKARALIDAGYEANFNGEAYSSVQFQNANLSVRLSDRFLEAVEAGEDWTTRSVTTRPCVDSAGNPLRRDDGSPVEIPFPVETWPASQLMDAIAEGTHFCGDPGVQFEDTIQRWHTCPNTAPINSSNPCSEYMFIDDSACNLASINLMKYRFADGTFDVTGFRHAVRIFLIAQEILVGAASYPTERIAANSHKFRPLGLGYANLGCLLMAMGLPYDSDEGRGIAAAITAIMQGEAYATSAAMASVVGPFAGFAANRTPMLRVVRMHRDAVDAIDPACPAYLRTAARFALDAAEAMGELYGYRNSQVTVLAPTGTIAFLMDCDTTGVEPDIALVKYKSLAGGGLLKIVNKTVELALAVLGYSPAEVNGIAAHIDVHDTIETVESSDGMAWIRSGLKDEHLPIFDCAFPPPQGGRSIHWTGHVKMMAAVQPFLSGAISKTVNMPEHSTVADIREAYLAGWKLGLKALAIYRDGSKRSQPLSTKKGEAVAGGLGDERAWEALRNVGRAVGVLADDGVDVLLTEEQIAAIEAAAAARELATVEWQEVTACEHGGECESPTVCAGPGGCVRAETKDAEPASLSTLIASGTATLTFSVPGTTALPIADAGAAPAGCRRCAAIDAEVKVERDGDYVRRRMPDTRRSLTHKFDIQGCEGYFTVGLYPDGSPGELFIAVAKGGSTIAGLMDVIGASVSIALQSGVPLETFVRKFAFTRFEPAGFTRNPDIPMAKSITDYIFRWLGMQFLPGYWEEHSPRAKEEPAAAPEPIRPEPAPGPIQTVSLKDPVLAPHAIRIVSQGDPALAPQPPLVELDSHEDLLAEVARRRGGKAETELTALGRKVAAVTLDPAPERPATTRRDRQARGFQSDAPACPNCGAITVRNGTCYRCFGCGESLGCS